MLFQNPASQPKSFYSVIVRDTPTKAHLQIDPHTASIHEVSPLLFGKFCEHLGSNIYGGMDSQLLQNPTFGKWEFASGGESSDGGIRTECNQDKIRTKIADFAEQLGYAPDNNLADDMFQGGALGWTKHGGVDNVVLSPDVGPDGGRAQRVETTVDGAGICQRVILPSTTVGTYEYRVVARSLLPAAIRLSLGDGGAAAASAEFVLEPHWQTFRGTIEIQLEDVDEYPQYLLTVLADAPANIVLSRVLLYPADHVEYADRTIVEMLRESQLPLLRWPGGNFVSGYNWRDGVGDIDKRPTRTNPAWGSLEYNLFGTAEFIKFCRNVGCEPMICINAGDGTPEEAANWLEYCNGPSDSPMGQLRTLDGFPEPFHVKYWEIGNEIWGKWQISWTTPEGNLDRYMRFVSAMRAVDSSVKFIGCGFPWWKDNAWDNALIEGAGPELRSITDHILTGGHVGPSTEPADLYHAFMGQSLDLARRYEIVREKMIKHGQPNPKIAITELQLFAHFNDAGEMPTNPSLTRDMMPHPGSISEALYFATIMHAAARTEGLVEMITHSATVNHGGGLRKSKQRVWANPVHYAHGMGIALAHKTPQHVTYKGPTISTSVDFENTPRVLSAPLIDALAVRHEDGSTVTVSLVNRGYGGDPVTVEIDCPGARGEQSAELTMLTGTNMWSENSYSNPTEIVPVVTFVDNISGFHVDLPPFTYATLTIELT